MSKDAIARIKETIDFVEAHPVADATSAADHALIVQWLKNWQRLSSPATVAKLSEMLSQNSAPNRATDAAARAYLRATTLTKCAIALPESGWANEAASDKAAPAGGGAGLYVGALRLARDHIHSAPDYINRMLGELKTHPVQFLGEHKLVINGGNKAGNPVQYKVAMKDGAYSFDCYGVNRGRVTVAAINVMATKYATVSANPGANSLSEWLPASIAQ